MATKSKVKTKPAELSAPATDEAPKVGLKASVTRDWKIVVENVLASFSEGDIVDDVMIPGLAEMLECGEHPLVPIEDGPNPPGDPEE